MCDVIISGISNRELKHPRRRGAAVEGSAGHLKQRIETTTPSTRRVSTYPRCISNRELKRTGGVARAVRRRASCRISNRELKLKAGWYPTTSVSHSSISNRELKHFIDVAVARRVFIQHLKQRIETIAVIVSSGDASHSVHTHLKQRIETPQPCALAHRNHVCGISNRELK